MTPENRNYCIILLLNCFFALDFTFALVTIEPYWFALHGNTKLYGFTFGSFDLCTVFTIPLLGVLIDRRIITQYRFFFFIGLVMNFIGNLCYALAYFFDAPSMIIIGRVVAGLGATTTFLTAVYVKDVFPISLQMTRMTYLKYSGALTRILGILIGCALSYGFQTNNAIFNLFTLPGWISAILALLLCPFVFLLQEPTINSAINSAINELKEPDIFVETTCLVDKKKTFWSCFFAIWCLQFIDTAVYWAWSSNYFIIALIEYQLITNLNQIWIIYIGLFCAMIASFFIYLIMNKIFQFTSNCILVVGSFFFISGIIFLIPYHNPPLLWPLFYTATFLMTIGYGFVIPALSGVNNILCKQYLNPKNVYPTLTLLLLSSFGALGRFIGPLIFSLTTVSQENYKIQHLLWFIIFSCIFSFVTTISYILIIRKNNVVV